MSSSSSPSLLFLSLYMPRHLFSTYVLSRWWSLDRYIEVIQIWGVYTITSVFPCNRHLSWTPNISFSLWPPPPAAAATTTPLSSCYLSSVNGYWWVHSFTLPLQHLPATYQACKDTHRSVTPSLPPPWVIASLLLPPSFSHCSCYFFIFSPTRKKELIFSFFLSIIWQSPFFFRGASFFHLRRCVFEHRLRFKRDQQMDCSIQTTVDSDAPKPTLSYSSSSAVLIAC